MLLLSENKIPDDHWEKYILQGSLWTSALSNSLPVYSHVHNFNKKNFLMHFPAKKNVRFPFYFLSHSHVEPKIEN